MTDGRAAPTRGKSIWAVVTGPLASGLTMSYDALERVAMELTKGGR